MRRERCFYCSDPATGTVKPSQQAAEVPACGSCRHAIKGHATSLKGVDARNGEATFGETRRRRRGGKGRFAQG
jgi:hypothetical protein